MNRFANPVAWWCDAMCLWVRLAQANAEAGLKVWRAMGVVPPGPVDSDVAAVVEAASRPAPAAGRATARAAGSRSVRPTPADAA